MWAILIKHFQKQFLDLNKHWNLKVSRKAELSYTCIFFFAYINTLWIPFAIHVDVNLEIIEKNKNAQLIL